MLLLLLFLKFLNMTRKEMLKNWLFNTYKKKIKLEIVNTDASFRSYYRIYHQKTSYIVMDAPPKQENITPFLKIANIMAKKGLNVPKIYYFDKKNGFAVLSDLGDKLYLPLLENKKNKLYKDAILALIKIQRCPVDSLPIYDKTLLLTEMSLFEKWYLQKHLKLKIKPQQQKILNDTCELLAQNALSQIQVFTHRDYHSRNLLKTSCNNPGIIDFQDAVCGAISYDLVSLLKDCYISHLQEEINKWVKFYLANCPLVSKISFDEFTKMFNLMGVQRHLKAIGIFARLKHRDKKEGYINDIPRTMNYIKNTCEIYPELAGFLHLITELKL
jgi:N-acetylmuramate 1-kinase